MYPTSMNPRDPHTWHHLAEHPRFASQRFDPTWYDGDVEADLRLLRDAAIVVTESFPRLLCELVVLDDATMYVRTSQSGKLIADLCPSRRDDGSPCIFIDFGAGSDEIRIDTPEEVVELLKLRIIQQTNFAPLR
jgi:hypothetical protein